MGTKAKVEKKKAVNVIGTLNLDNEICFEVDNQVFMLKDLLKEYNGTFGKFSYSVTDEIAGE